MIMGTPKARLTAALTDPDAADAMLRLMAVLERANLSDLGISITFTVPRRPAVSEEIGTFFGTVKAFIREDG